MQLDLEITLENIFNISSEVRFQSIKPSRVISEVKELELWVQSQNLSLLTQSDPSILND